ncbi:MAG: hypothetical protein ACXVPN_10665 [Bacteroidia bacterium]
MFRTVIEFTIAFVFITFSAGAQESGKKQKIKYAKEGYEKAVVINYNVDGCGFMFQLMDKRKSKISPDRFPEEFKKEKMKVWIKYASAKKQPVTTCMAGHFCELIDIQKRK